MGNTSNIEPETVKVPAQTESISSPSTGTTSADHSAPRRLSPKRPSRKGTLTPHEPRSVLDHPRIASYAFALDIDGVILRGHDTIPEAPKAIRMLNGENKYNIKVPHIFVTNGGGKSEETRCHDLSQRLGVSIEQNQIIQGHTPMRDLAQRFSTVLVVGGVGEACRQVAEQYGFQDVVTPGDILKWDPSVSPYRTLSEEELESSRDRDFSKTSIDAIFVFADSREWASDQQIILELLMSKNGVMGTVSETFEDGPEIFFAHNDFVWSTNYNLNRYGMGALRVSIAALYEEHTGKKLTKVTQYGKPHLETFKYVQKVLTGWQRETFDKHFEMENEQNSNGCGEEEKLLNEIEQNNSSITDEVLPNPSTVYFVGDTPDSDIRFANTFDKSWHSILVRTGVYREGTVPRHIPKHTCDNILKAVEYAIEREHEKELDNYNRCVREKLELPVPAVEYIHPHILESVLVELKTKSEVTVAY